MPFLTTLGLISGGLSSAQQFFAGASATRRAKQGLEDFEFQDLSVGAFDQYKPSLAAEEQQLESVERQRARVADVASGLGASEAMALLSQTEQQLSQTEQQAFARQEQLMAQADMLRAQDLQRRQQMQEQRDLMEVQGLQQEFASGQQMMASGLGGFAQLATSAGLSQELAELENAKEGKEKKDKGLSRYKGSDGNINGVSSRKMLKAMNPNERTGFGNFLSSIGSTLGGLFKRG